MKKIPMGKQIELLEEKIEGLEHSLYRSKKELEEERSIRNDLYKQLEDTKARLEQQCHLSSRLSGYIDRVIQSDNAQREACGQDVIRDAEPTNCVEIHRDKPSPFANPADFYSRENHCREEDFCNHKRIYPSY